MQGAELESLMVSHVDTGTLATEDPDEIFAAGEQQSQSCPTELSLIPFSKVWVT